MVDSDLDGKILAWNVLLFPFNDNENKEYIDKIPHKFSNFIY